MPESPSRTVLLGTDNTDSTVTGVTTGTSMSIPRANFPLMSIFFRSIGTTSGGTIIVEEADWGILEPVYTGTWSQLTSVSASAFTGGAQQAYHVTPCALGRIRVRISSDITGGGSVYIVLRCAGDY